jgi:MFS family permease
MAWTGEVTGEAATQTSEKGKPRLRYAWYVVIILMVCYTLSFIDRQILALLVGPIKKELSLSDSRMGLLGGLAFALFYTFLGLPMGRLADTKSRRTIVAIGVFLWSLMTGTCALARSFTSLFLARMGVGVGEAALAPSAFSLITDYFPREQLGTALSVYSMGIFIGSGLALMISGAVIGALSHLPPINLGMFGTIASWRLTFFIVGVPGLVVSCLAFTVREPLRRNLLATKQGHQPTKLSIREVASQLKLRWQSVFGVAFAFAFQSSCTYGFGFWGPTFLIRVHHWDPSKTGMILGIITLVTGVGGMYLGGRLCDRWQRLGLAEAPLKVGVIGTGGSGIFFVLAMIAPTPVWSLAGIIPGLFLLAMPIGTAHASMQLILPNQVRGQISALYLFILNTGLVIGPYLPGAFNDYLFKNEQMLAYSIALTMAICSGGAVILLKATYRPYRIHYALMHNQK